MAGGGREVVSLIGITDLRRNYCGSPVKIAACRERIIAEPGGIHGED
jgi:hypothetical protein